MVWKNLQTWPHGLLEFHRNLMVGPFESAIATMSVWFGIGTFYGATFSSIMFNDTVPAALATAFNILYILSGCFLLVGLGWRYRNVEASGLIIFVCVLAARSTVLFAQAGYNPITAQVIGQSCIFGLWALVRLYTLLKGWTTVIIREAPKNGQ